MGDPRRLKKKYKKPSHPFQKQRIEEELRYLGEYGLRSKRLPIDNNINTK